MSNQDRDAARLLFGDEDRTDLYEIFRRGGSASYDGARFVLDGLKHPELTTVNQI